MPLRTVPLVIALHSRPAELLHRPVHLQRNNVRYDMWHITTKSRSQKAHCNEKYYADLETQKRHQFQTTYVYTICDTIREMYVDTETQ